MIDEARKPRICELLGVDVGEWFSFRYPHKDYKKCCVNAGGKIVEMWNTGKLHKVGSGAVCWLINNPGCIIRKPRFMEEEAADAKTIIRLFGGWIVSIERSMNRCLFFKSKDGDLVIANKFLFPSISPGHTVAISDIVEEGAP